MAGPSAYNDDIANEICELIASGSNFNRLSKLERFPSESTLRRWTEENEGFAAKYARARECRADARSDRIDKYKRMMLQGKLTPEQCRVAIDAEKWQAGKEKPKVYGEKQQVDHSGTVTLSALVENSYKLPSDKPNMIDITPDKAE